MITLLPTYSPELLAIETESHVAPWPEATLQSCFQSGYSVYVCRDRESSVMQGFYIAQQVCDELTLMNIAVRPGLQGQGIGGRLLTHLLAHAKAQDLVVWLEVRASNRKAHALYSKHGFQHVGTRPNYYPSEHGREDALVMRWAPTETRSA